MTLKFYEEQRESATKDGWFTFSKVRCSRAFLATAANLAAAVNLNFVQAFYFLWFHFLI